MVKKWSEVTANEAYQKLPETQKAAAQEQYFSQIVAPQVPEADVGIAREQFFNYASGIAPKPSAPTTFQSKVEAPPAPKNVGSAADSYGTMGEYIDPTPTVEAPSVMNQVQGQQIAPPATTPVKPEVRAAFQARYDAANPKQRKVMESQPNWMGDLARARAAEMAKMDVAKTKAPSLESFDPRVEARRATLVGKGEKPGFAETAAQDAAAMGITPGNEINYQRYKGLAEPRPVNEALASEFEKAGLLKRGIESGRSGLRQQIYGLAQAGAELVGADEFVAARGLDYEDEEKLQNSIGQNPDYWKRQTEGAVNSIAQQAPMTAFALMSGGSAIPLAGMFVQQFGGSYAESRKMGLDPTEATERSAWMALAEVLGEVPGFGKELKLLRGSLKNAPLESLKGWVINTAKKEVLGEQFTLAMQTLGDIKGATPFGTKEVPTIEQYLEQAKDTLVQTIMQSAIMGGGATAVGKSAQLITGFKPEQELPSIPSAEQLMRDKGFLAGKFKVKGEAPLETAAGERAAATTETPKQRIEPTMGEPTTAEKAVSRQKKVDDLAAQIVERQGIPGDDAVRIAEGKVRAQEEIETKRQDKLQGEVAGRTTLVEPAEDRVAELTDMLVGAGMPPTEAAHRATLMAQEEAENDKLAETEAKGGTRAGKPITTTGGAGAGVPSERATGLPTTGATAPDTAGLGVAGEPAGESAVREAVQPSTLTEGEPSVTETTQTEQTEEEGSQAPAAATTGVSAVQAAEADVVNAQKAVSAAYQEYSPSERESPEVEQKIEAAEAQFNAALRVKEKALVDAIEEQKTKTGVNTKGVKAPTPVQQDASMPSGNNDGHYPVEVELPALLALAQGNFKLVTLKDGTKVKLVIGLDMRYGPGQGTGGRVTAYNEQNKDVGVVLFSEVEDEKGNRFNPHSFIDEAYQRKGLGTAMYDLAEANGALFPELSQKGQIRSPAAEAFRQKREAEKQKAIAPKKRGRPALAPEQKLTAEQKRVQQRAAYKATDKQVNTAEQMFAESSAPIDEGAIESEAQLREMQDDKRRQRRAAIRTLYDISRVNKGKPGQRAAALLKDPSITPRELVEAEQGYELRKKAGALNISKSSKEAVEAAASEQVPDAELGKVTNGAQAITRIIKTGTEFQKTIARRLRSVVGGLKIVVVEEGQPLPEQLVKNPRIAAEWDRARALYIENEFSKDKILYVRGASFGADQGVNNITMLHELFHAATNRKIMLAEKARQNGDFSDKPLMRAYQDLIDTMLNAGDYYEKLRKNGTLPERVSRLSNVSDIFGDPREFVAYGMTDPIMQEFLKEADGAQSTVSFFKPFVDALRRLVGIGEDDTNALADLISATDAILTAREVGKPEPLEYVSRSSKIGEPLDETAKDAVRTQKEIDKEVAIDLEKIRISRQAEELARGVSALQALRDPRKILPALRRLWKGANYAQRSALVNPVTTEFLAAWSESDIPELKNTNVLLEKMSGLTQQLLHSSAILAQTVHKAFKEDATLQHKLEEVAYASTLAEIDPSDPNADERSPTLDKLYAGLGLRGQQMFVLVKDHYENLSAYFGQLLDDQITNSRISPEAKNTLMAKIRKIYEADKKITPYFPLVRRGDFWLAFGSGKNRKFFTFETMAERDAAAEGFAKERRTPLAQLKEDADFTVGNDLGSMRKASFDSSDLLKGLFDIIDAENLGDPSAKDELKDAVYQLYLTTMPEQSFRRQFISRKNITGFSTDLLRNLSTTGVKMSTQLARVKYSPLLRNSISAARDSIAGREELEPFVKEMEKRVGETLNPAKEGVMGVVGNVANRASFLHYLSGASSALLQPLGVFQTGMPILMARYGVVGTTVQLTKMLRVWDQYGITRTNPDGTQSFVAPSIANATGFTPDEKRAVREMLARDVSQSTYASALFGYKSAATINYGSIAERGKRAAATLTGGLIHSTERLSREMLFMASYRLNRNAGKTHEPAVDNAVRDTNEALGNYGSYNRPPIMKKGLGKVMLQFTMYLLHVTLFLLRNFKKSLPLLNKEGKWEATKIFYGTLGTSYVVAGAVGLPMFSMVMGLLGWAWRDEDKPQELKDMDYETWWRTVFLPEQLGDITIGGHKLSDIVERGPINALTGLDISSRTGLNDLWLRDTKETKTARESAVALALEKAGPSANMILSYADAYEAMINGDYQKAVEKISPALIRNFVMMHKYATEGAKDNKGAEIMAQGTFTSGELLGQAIGFRSDLLANTQRVAFKMAAIDQRVNNERTKLLNNIAREYTSGENTNKWDGYLKQLDKREKFNTRYPEKAITEDQLVDSLEKRQKQRGESWAGVTVDEKSMPYAAEPMLNITSEIERREKEMGKRK